MTKILIIGTKGMLGQELVRAFEGGDYEVVAWDLENIDITDRQQIRTKIRDQKPKIIINASGYNAVDKAEEPEEFELAKKVNGYGPGYLAEVAKELGAVFVNYSSDYVFNGEKEEGYKENDAVSPISKYGESKVLGEKEVKEKGEKYYIVRLQKLFGRPAQSQTAKKSFFETMLTLAETRDEMDGVDEELANFTYAPDLAAQTKYLIERELPFGVYHITNEGNPVTWYDAARILFDIAGKKVKLNRVSSDKFPRPAKRPRYAVLLNTKLPPLRPWDEALREFLNQEKN